MQTQRDPQQYVRNLSPATFLAQVTITFGIMASQLSTGVRAETLKLESDSLQVRIDAQTGQWSLKDKRSGVSWPTEETAGPGSAEGLGLEFTEKDTSVDRVRLQATDGAAVAFELVNAGRSLQIQFEGEKLGDIRFLGDALTVTSRQRGHVIVPCREGLLIPADSGVAFKKAFGTSDYEGCHMNMLGLLKGGSGLVVTWEDAYVTPQIESQLPSDPMNPQQIVTSFTLRGSARSVQLTPLGKGDWNTIAAGYRRIAEQKGLAVTLTDKIERDPHLQLLMGAIDFKLWTCLSRRMNEESTKEESVNVRWTFDEAASIAEHLRNDLDIERCLFMMGGWTEGGYDCRHPDNLPANPECGGNEALTDAIRRIQDLGFVACLHDNYQDMYRDAKSWDPSYIEKRPDGSLIQGGRWLGGRAFMVCAPKQLELAMRPQNLPDIQRLFRPWSYFIDTTYAVGPRQCDDPQHPIGRNDDIAWKIQLSDKTRELFGLFGSECGREWALPHSDFFEGLVGVSGKYFHNLQPETLGATVIPFWEMVYHDCQICWGKYGYDPRMAGQYVAHHVLAARPLHYHFVPDHLYWKQQSSRPAPTGDAACFMRTDNGWAEGLHPLDSFVKTTYEVLGPLHQATAHQRLTKLEISGEDNAIRKATYGSGAEATTVLVNFGPEDAAVETRLGSEAVLPTWGFLVESPRFTAFYAKRWGGRAYASGALFTVQSDGEAGPDQTDAVRIFHGFGDSEIVWQGKTHSVRREQVVNVP